jgi:hypothetical protein
MLNNLIKKTLRLQGYELIKTKPSFPPDFDQLSIETITKVSDYTATSPERIFSLCEAVKYLIKNEIEGDIVECGVYKGGSMMTVAYTLLSMNEKNRHLWLYDTFEGMTPPDDIDKDFQGRTALQQLQSSQKEAQESIWCYSSLEDVQKAMELPGYPKDKIHFIKGKVEDTLPSQSPKKIALLRLDTDWYQSTYHSLVHLFPCLSPGGVLIIDDYGHWQGARQAVDNYIKENNIKLLLTRIDYTGRIGVVANI